MAPQTRLDMAGKPDRQPLRRVAEVIVNENVPTKCVSQLVALRPSCPRRVRIVCGLQAVTGLMGPEAAPVLQGLEVLGVLRGVQEGAMRPCRAHCRAPRTAAMVTAHVHCT